MGKTSKLIAFEFKKLFSNIAVYIITSIVVIATIILGFIYKPTNRTENILNYNGNNVISIYNSFYNTSSNLNKYYLDDELNNLENYIAFYMNTNNAKENLTSYFNSAKQYYENTYRQNLYAGNSSTFLSNSSAELSNRLIILNNYLDEILTEDKELILITTENFNNLTQNLKALIQTVPNTYNDYPYHQSVVSKIESNNYFSKIQNYIQSVNNINLKAEEFTSLKKDYIDKARVNLTEVEKQIHALNSEKSGSVDTNDIKQMNALVNKYYQIVRQTKIIVANTTKLEIVSSIENSNKIKDYYSLSTYNKYDNLEILNKNNYLFNKGLVESDYGYTFNFNKTSDSSTNLYDFSYYAIEIITVILIIFAIYLVSVLFANELSSGTIKYLAVRPFNRRKIFRSKLLTIIIFTIFLLLLSTIVSICVGSAVYPSDSIKNILVVINAKQVAIMNPFALLFIELAFSFVKILFFTLIAIFVAVLSKSNLATFITSLGVYILTIIFNIFLPGQVWYSYFPTANINLFKFFGNSSESSDVIQSIFSNNLIAGSTLLKTCISLGIFMVIIFYLSYSNFRNKDLA